MAKNLQNKGVIRQDKMLRAAVFLFLKNGYEKTTTASISLAAGMGASTFFGAFESKEALLLALVKIMYDNQFDSAEKLPGVPQDPVLLYAVETSIQMYITELSEQLRELYVMAYSLPTTSEYIYKKTSEKLEYIFAPYLTQAQAKDFYEMDIASSGITRAFMAKSCDVYFTMEKKLTRYLGCCLTLYKVPEEKQQQVIQTVLQMNLKPIAEKIISEMKRKAEEGWALLK